MYLLSELFNFVPIPGVAFPRLFLNRASIKISQPNMGVDFISANLRRVIHVYLIDTILTVFCNVLLSMLLQLLIIVIHNIE